MSSEHAVAAWTYPRSTSLPPPPHPPLFPLTRFTPTRPVYAIITEYLFISGQRVDQRGHDRDRLRLTIQYDTSDAALTSLSV